MASSVDLISLAVPCDLHAPAVVRAALTKIHDGGWSLDDGQLVASELVGNAVRHSGCAPDHHLQVTVSRRGGRLLIAVDDPGLSGQAAEVVVDGHPEAGGWGIHIIGTLSEAWGTERSDGYRVWAELAADG
jgi:anti-sigma regulatory factor (Ser/Thr protein kinase)